MEEKVLEILTEIKSEMNSIKSEMSSIKSEMNSIKFEMLADVLIELGTALNR